MDFSTANTLEHIRHTATCWIFPLQHTATANRIMDFSTATHCNTPVTLQRAEQQIKYWISSLQHTLTHCNTTVTVSNAKYCITIFTLQQTATHVTANQIMDLFTASRCIT